MHTKSDCDDGHIKRLSSKARAFRPKSIATEVSGLMMLDGNVIPKRDASRIKGHYLTASRALMRSTKFTANEKLVIIYLTDMLMDKEHCWPSHKTIACYTGMSRRTMITAVNGLVDAGVILRVPGIGSGRSTDYYLTQALFPCRNNPEVLCDRDSCQEQCPWRGDNSADPALLAPGFTENKQCDTGTLSQPNSVDSAPFMPVKGADLAHEEKDYKKEADGKRSCPPGAGDPEPCPPLPIEMPTPGSESGHSQVKNLFCQMYDEAFGKSYIWGGQDGGILKGILKLDIALADIKAAIENMFRDKWLMDKGLVSMKMFKSSINKYLPSSKPQASGQGSDWDSKAIKVHTRPQAGEELLDWPWPRTGKPRIDRDIPRKIQNRGMHEFSSALVHMARDWFRAPGKRGSWLLALIGMYGNGKSSFAASLLQAWRDHMLPELESYMLPDRDLGEKQIVNLDSQFVTFEEFKEFCHVETSNPNTGWVGPAKVDAEYIEKLSQVNFLVLDDVCSCDADKVHLGAMQDLLRKREEKGKMTVITTNKTLAELGKLLGGSVADRLTAGMVLKFVDESQRDLDNPAPTGPPQARNLPRTMPNPSMDSDKANIPYVEPESENCGDISAADQMQVGPEPGMGSVENSHPIDPDAMVAALASINDTLESPQQDDPDTLAAPVANVDTALASAPTG